MAFQILLNVFIAFVWMFLSNSFSAATFIIGYILGLVMLFMLRRFFSTRFYIERVVAVAKLLLLFLKELIVSNIAVLRVILKPKMDIKPAIFELETKLTQDWEITLLSMLITLTPGTVVINISEDRTKLYVHTLDLEDVDNAVNSIRNTFEKAIMEVSR
ncbi:multicomponent Na+:H+ antiporter subunit E [Chryseomicrobium aureum]|uniref:Na+/H+ antiporter subunit E n=1 Tax=Chryseomicrobium aureum TaxID=1441723 RepID=UPI0019599B45|nr:Na+/H+ antiporter subunit E [Chryseomicrobium aureum]MBM7707723.1 multicomponent Na+:H+ antiporter subunit E [Chryseomicrobium aureum]